ncbi:Protocadherin gamma-A4 [Triplophysa tibetana]|uniref:Protocadherin gamma-A4 n=1 Tax=Triplophysa tibetana TaxID=1572043 RepID=A0A5A9NJY0_9TELE|nr:Protocadherin gamma-A4 [Triplophysa tibetana]
MFNFQVLATDSGSPSLSSNVTVNVFILDQNDNVPVILYPVSANGSAEGVEEIPRNVNAGHLVTKVRAYDADIGYNGWLLFSLQEVSDHSLFSLDRYTGQIRTLRSFTETDEAQHKLVVLVKDNGNVSLSATATVIVKVVEPKEAFAASDVKHAVKEEEENNETFYLIITLGSVSVLFIISIIVLVVMQCSKSTDYSSKYLQDMNYDGTLCHSIQYRSGDKRYMLVGPRMSIGSTLAAGSNRNTLVIPDRRRRDSGENDNVPVILYPVSANGSAEGVEEVPRNVNAGHLVTKVRAYDADIGYNGWLLFSLLEVSDHSLFSLDRYTGQIRTLRSFIETDEAQHKLVILVKDNGNVSLSATVTVIVKVVEPKEAFAASDVESSVKDEEENNVTFYLIITLGSVSVLFIISIIVLIVMQCSKTTDYSSKYLQDMNYDGTLCHSIQYRSGDKRYMLVGPRMSIGSTLAPGSNRNTLVIPDHRRRDSGENDNVPVILYPVSANGSAEGVEEVPRNVNAGHLVTKVRAYDADIGYNGWLLFSLQEVSDHSLFSLDRYTGQIRTLRSLTETDEAQHKLVILVKDNGNVSLSATATVIVKVVEPKEAFAASDVENSVKDEEENNVTFYLIITLGSVSVLFIISIIVLIVMQCSKSTDYSSKYLQDMNYDGTLCHSIQYRSGDKRYMLVGPRMSIGSTLAPGSNRNTLVVSDHRRDSGESRRKTFSERVRCKMGQRMYDKWLEWHLKIFFIALSLFCWETVWAQIRYSISEEQKDGSAVGNIAKDLGINQRTLQERGFRIVSTSGQSLFSVNQNDGVLYVNGKIDREAVCERIAPCLINLKIALENPLEIHYVTVDIIDVNDHAPRFPEQEKRLEIGESVLPDSGSPSLSSNVTINVFILDQNDNVPVILYPVSANGSAEGVEEIPRNVNAGHLVTKVRAYDADIGYNGWLLFSLLEVSDHSLFSLDRYTGQIRTLRSFTETDEAQHKLVILVKDNGNVSLSATATVIVKVVEPKEAFAASDVKNAVIDEEENNVTFYLIITMGSVSVLFIISIIVLIVMQCSKSTDYSSKYLQDMNYDGTLCHSIQYRSGDKRYMLVGPRMSIGSTLAPGSNRNTLVVSDHRRDSGEKDGSAVGNIAKDLGIDQRALQERGFRIVSTSGESLFSVNQNDGVLYVNGVIDREEVCERIIPCLVNLKIALENPLEIHYVTVDIIDVNDHAPKFPEREKRLEISETVLPGARFQLQAARDPDSGSNSVQIYKLSHTDYFRIEIIDRDEDGKVPVLILQKPLDRELLIKMLVKVALSAIRYGDSGSPSLSSNVTINVFILDQNDNVPVILYPVSANGSAEGVEEIPRNVNAGHLVTKVRAYDADIGYNGWLLFSLLEVSDHSLFSLDRYTGQIRTLRSFTETDEAQHKLVILVKDNGNVSLSATATVIVKVVEPKEAFAASDVKNAVIDEEENNVTFYLIITLGSVSVLFIISIIVLIVMQCSKSTDYSSKYLQDMNYDGTLCHSIQYRSGDKRYMLVGPRMSIGSTLAPGSNRNTLVVSDRGRRDSGEVRDYKV